MRLRCKGINPDDHPVKKEFVSVSNTSFMFVSQPSFDVFLVSDPSA